MFACVCVVELRRSQGRGKVAGPNRIIEATVAGDGDGDGDGDGTP